MDCTRRELLRGFLRPDFWTGPDGGPGAGTPGPAIPDGQDIILQPDQCIAWGRGVCDRCERACPEQAILFVGMQHPRIMARRCTLCGDCVPVCPTTAIAIRPGAGLPAEQGEIA